MVTNETCADLAPDGWLCEDHGARGVVGCRGPWMPPAAWEPVILTHATTQPQPLAWAQAAGHCPVILSDTRPDLARIGELLGIHASRERVSAEEWFSATQPLPHTVAPPEDQPRGALVGVVRLVGVIRRWSGVSTWRGVDFERQTGRGPIWDVLTREECARIRPWWRSGTKWGLLLSEAVLLSEPIPMRGSGGVWRIPSMAVPHLAEPHASQRLAADWALEQWRKARGQ